MAFLSYKLQLAAEFVVPGGVGETLHKLLTERAAKKDNWLSEWWLEGAYLGYRNPVVVYSSPAMVMPRQEFRSAKDQLAYAASLIQAVLDFKVRRTFQLQNFLDKKHEPCLTMDIFHFIISIILLPHSIIQYIYEKNLPLKFSVS